MTHSGADETLANADRRRLGGYGGPAEGEQNAELETEAGWPDVAP